MRLWVSATPRATADLATVLHEKHVRLTIRRTCSRTRARAGIDRKRGFGVRRSAHVAGDVGYIDLRMFAGSRPERDLVIDGLADSVAYSDAVILDLRQNHGGDPDAVARLLSHVLPSKTHLNDFAGRGDGDAKVVRSTQYRKDRRLR